MSDVEYLRFRLWAVVYFLAVLIGYALIAKALWSWLS